MAAVPQGPPLYFVLNFFAAALPGRRFLLC